MFVVGAATAAVGGAVAIGLGAWALHLDAALGDARASPEYRGLALDAEPLVIGGAVVGAAIAAGGGAIILMDAAP